MKYYAVKLGVTPGIYTSWKEAEPMVRGFKGAIFKSFESLEEAKDFMSKDKVTIDEVEMEKMDTFAFVDGSFNKSTGIYGAGYFIFHRDDNGDTSYCEGSLSGKNEKLVDLENVAGEMLAAQSALIRATLYKQYKEIYIFFDYQGIQSWADGTWACNNMGTLSYHQFIEEMSEKIKIHFVKVKGHSNQIMNDYVDLLAKKGCNVDVDEEKFKTTQQKLFNILNIETGGDESNADK